MKELSIEEKAKRYDEAIKIINDYYQKIKYSSFSCASNDREVLERAFPELRESEDGRIRTKLIEFFAGYTTDEEWWGSITEKDILAWLEKQESVEEIVERCKTSWYNEGKIQGKMEGLSDDEKYQQGWHDALEKQGKQKPAWSEEDDIMVHDIDYALRCQITYPISKLQSMSNWILNLKDRVQPQQEWSEEDEKMLNEIIMCGEHHCYLDAGNIAWLKYLKDKYAWKPSDRELGAILVAIGDERQKGSDMAKDLLNIYQYLKKLRDG